VEIEGKKPKKTGGKKRGKREKKKRHQFHAHTNAVSLLRLLVISSLAHQITIRTRTKKGGKKRKEKNRK